jgi:hypothetical protein|tara:strand:+ start:2124 stop:2699 length:576 start_codon:yes stop_codon:yes gene_type:complete
MIKRRDDQYIDGIFTWFTGIIRDIDDKENLNRVKVQALGFYDDDIPTADLPWATVMMPVTAASLQGNGGNHHLEVGTWVVGFMRDGPSAQDPMVMGSIATQTEGTQDTPSTSSTTNKVHHTKAGHKIEIENKEGDETITVQHAKGAKLVIDKDNNMSISGVKDFSLANSGTTSISSVGAITITSSEKTTIV